MSRTFWKRRTEKPRAQSFDESDLKMDDKTRQSACDAFNILKMNGQLHSDCHYNFVEGPTTTGSPRDCWERAMAPYMALPDG
jgi:hypothetical protein